jgi:hypothetical protein
MRFVTVYLIAYFALIIGAVAALWAGGALQHIPATWTLIGLMVAIGLGALLAVTALNRPGIPE